MGTKLAPWQESRQPSCLQGSSHVQSGETLSPLHLSEADSRHSNLRSVFTCFGFAGCALNPAVWSMVISMTLQVKAHHLRTCAPDCQRQEGRGTLAGVLYRVEQKPQMAPLTDRKCSSFARAEPKAATERCYLATEMSVRSGRRNGHQVLLSHQLLPSAATGCL